MVDVEIWLPQNGSCALLAIEVDDGSQRTFARRFTDFSTPCATAADLPDDLYPNGNGYERIGQRRHALAG